MSDVELSIGGRRYKLACAAGEEEHIAALGRTVDARLCAMPALSRQSEAQTLLYATLLLADELHDKAAAPAAFPAPSPAEPQEEAVDLAGPLERLARRLESIAAELEHGPQSA